MSFPENWIFFFKQKKGVGGNQNPPPTPCLRPAYGAACVPAYAERTGRPRAQRKVGDGSYGTGPPNWGIFAMEAGS